MSAGEQTPSSTNRIDSITSACSNRLTAKPTTSFTRIGALPIPVSVAAISSAKPGSVSAPGITSTRRMRETGEKKCVPMKRARRASPTPELSVVMEIEEVFDASPA